MPIFYFHINECGSVTTDDEGVDLPDLETARTYAIRGARGIMAAEVLEGRLCTSCSIMIHDMDARVLAVPFSEAVIHYGP